MHAVELIRASGDGQHAAGTPEAQRRALDELRVLRPAEIVERIDPGVGISGALPIDRRPDIQRLRALIEAGSVDELRVVAIDRITRADDLGDRLHVLTLCARHGVLIVEPPGRVIDPSQALGQVEYVMRATWAAEERQRIRARTMGGRERRAAEGQLVQRLGYGYRPIPRISRAEPPRYEIDPSAAEVIRRIYARVIAGDGLRQIALELDDAGVPTARGGRWAASSVARLVRTETYRGRFHQLGGASVIEVPAIVSDETWQAAQAALDARYRRRGRPGTIPALVRGRAWCGICGQSMHVVAVGRGSRRAHYVCRTATHRTRETTCGSPWYRSDTIDERVWSVLRDVIEQPDVLAAASDDGSETWREQVAQCDATLQRARRDEERVLGLLRRDLVTLDAAEEQLRRIRAARETAERSRALAERAIADAERHASVAADAVETYGPLLDAADYPTRRQLAEALLPDGREYGAWLYADRIEVVGVLAAAGAAPMTEVSTPPTAW